MVRAVQRARVRKGDPMISSRALALSSLVFSAACATGGLPTETMFEAQPLTVVVPKEVENANGPLHGVVLDAIDRDLGPTDFLPGVHSDSSAIHDFFSVSSAPAPSGDLVTTVCRG